MVSHLPVLYRSKLVIINRLSVPTFNLLLVASLEATHYIDSNVVTLATIGHDIT